MSDTARKQQELKPFLADQWGRVKLRAVVFGLGLAAAVFWTGVLLGAAWLKAYGLEAVAFGLGLVWAAISLPAVMFQLIMIVDALSLAFLGQILAYPVLVETIRQGRERKRVAQPERAPSLVEQLRHRVLYVAHVTCPLSAISTWCLIVLSRAPKSTHALTREETIREILAQVDREDDLVSVAIGRMQAA